jgi:hypothetical protein
MVKHGLGTNLENGFNSSDMLRQREASRCISSEYLIVYFKILALNVLAIQMLFEYHALSDIVDL